MTITLRGTNPVTIASAYAPTAVATAEDKDNFYNALTKLTKKFKKKGILYIGSDMNAKLIDPGDGDDGIGPHIFGQDPNVNREEGQGVEDNRARLQEYLIDTKTTLANTLFPKTPQCLITYKSDKTAGNEPPYDKTKYETLDYFITHRKWRNTIRNAHSNMRAGVDTDHFPLQIQIRIKLKAEYGKRNVKPKYEPCSDTQRKELNDIFRQEFSNVLNPSHESLTASISKAAANTMTKKLPNPARPFEYSDTTEALLLEKKQKIRTGSNDTELKPLRNQISKSIRKDKRKYEAEMIGPNLDIRDQYMGLRNLRKPFVPCPLSMKNKHGQHVPLYQRAQCAAEFLRDQIWGEAHTNPQELINQIATERLVADPIGLDLSDISLEEIEGACRNLKRRKAAGPDGIPVDIYKELDRKSLELLRALINGWWKGDEITTEVTQAQVVLIFKKGNKADLGNYRPISLLNTTYKIYTTILQQRLAKALDKHLQPTQYGFRAKKSTANAVHYVRRVMEKGEKTNTKTLLVLLDWEKAFDKVRHESLFSALARMNVPEQYVKAIKELYRQPTFKVEMEGKTSSWEPQTTGIRQGCPLSPYLFIILMTVLFMDIHKNDTLQLKQHRVQGMDTDEILYADDTICISEDEQAMSRLLAAIEVEGAKYGLKLNKKKCEYLYFGQAGRVFFSDGSPVPKRAEVKYLGCNMNNRADPEREIIKRKKDCMITLQKLHIFFYNSDNTVTRKMQMFNAVMRAKLMYGLETIVMNTRVKHMLDAFQLKCLRKILKIPTTYIDKQFSNDIVRLQINNHLKAANKKPMETLTAYHQRCRVTYLAKLICKGDLEPGTSPTIFILSCI